jgi:hypothetical protein
MKEMIQLKAILDNLFYYQELALLWEVVLGDNE